MFTRVFNITNRFKIILIIIIFFNTFSTSANVTFNNDNKVNFIFRNLNVEQSFNEIRIYLNLDEIYKFII